MNPIMNGHFATPAAPFSNGAPAPPAVVIPPPTLSHAHDPIQIVPSYNNIDPASLSPADLSIITRNGRQQLAHDSSTSWQYEHRRTAQPILDFLYLGPSSVARDRNWLRDNGITMLLAARDSRMAEARLMSVNKVAQELGIQAEYVDVSSYSGLISVFPAVVQKINDHMLNVYRGQAINGDGHSPSDGSMVIDQQKFRRGKVLVFCETGNHRSPGVVAAYLMTVWGMDMVKACQFIVYKRFCVNMDESLKQVLMTYQDLLVARRACLPYQTKPSTANAKRRIQDTMIDGDGDQITDEFLSDRDRYRGRAAFAPFVEGGN